MSIVAYGLGPTPRTTLTKVVVQSAIKLFTSDDIANIEIASDNEPILVIK